MLRILPASSPVSSELAVIANYHTGIRKPLKPCVDMCFLLKSCELHFDLYIATIHSSAKVTF